MNEKEKYYNYTKEPDGKKEGWFDKHPTAYSYIIIGGSALFCIVATVISIEIFAAATARRVNSKVGR